MVLNFVVIFGIIEVVYRPLTYILHLPAEVITAAADAGSIAAGYAQQSGIISAVVTGNSAVMARWVIRCPQCRASTYSGAT